MIFWLVRGFCDLDGSLFSCQYGSGWCSSGGCEVVGWRTLELWFLEMDSLFWGLFLSGAGWCERMDFW